MRKIFLSVCAALAVLFTCSCNKDDAPKQDIPQGEKAVVNFSLAYQTSSPLTKATGAAHGVQAEDNTVNSVEFLIFNEAGNLEAYQKFNSTSNLKMVATVGAKTIYAVVNNKDVTLVGATTLAKFKALSTSIKSEAMKNFTMMGSTEVTLTANSTVPMTVARIAARVKLSKISLDLSGTLYAGQSLTNVKIYLVNVHGRKLIWNGAGTETPLILNSKKYVEGDNQSLGITNMLYDELGSSIADNGTYDTPHYFYAYANNIETQTDSERYTRLVIQGDLSNLGTRYWKVDINRDGYGYRSGTVPGIEANKSYEYTVTLKNIGDDDPDKKPEKSNVTVTLTVADWTVVPNGEVAFN